jgi:anti-anti-sigma factor
MASLDHSERIRAQYLAVMADVTIHLEGEVDVATAPKLRRDLHQAIEQNPGATITVDLGGVSFLDSTGLGLLVSGLKRARSDGGDVVVANAAPNVRKVFDITGLSKVIPFQG